MLRCSFDHEIIEGLCTMVKTKNDLSPLNKFTAKELPKDNIKILQGLDLIDSEMKFTEKATPVANLLSNPYAVAKVFFTGGVGAYEHSIIYDEKFSKHVSLTVAPDAVTIDDEMEPGSIVEILEDLIGRSNLKSVNIKQVFSVDEALVVAAMLDMERKANLRAFVDEIPFTSNYYTASNIWRIIYSTTPSIQWFVYIINEIVGSNTTLTLQQVETAIKQLAGKGVVTENGSQYRLSADMSLLSGRMIVVDNVLSVQASVQGKNNEIVNSGFTCVQSGVHDLLFLDYNNKDVIFETISSVRLKDYLLHFFNAEACFPKLLA